MEHIPAIHAAKVGMRYPARVTGCNWSFQELVLDLSALAPGRAPVLDAILRFTETVSSTFAQMLGIGHQIEVVLIEVDRERGRLIASLPANSDWLTWNNETVRHLARRIRATGETVLMPVLADALEEAGCTDAALLEHCRQPQDDPYSWAVTLLATQE